MTGRPGPDPDTLADPHAALRERLAVRLECGAVLGKLASGIGLWPDALAAFARGAHLAPWASERLAAVLDQVDGEAAE